MTWQKYKHKEKAIQNSTRKRKNLSNYIVLKFVVFLLKF
jgi:hypothetical protein